MKNYYKIIDVPFDASAEEIRKAYHRKVKQLHPDKNPENKMAASLFLDVQEAYDVLSNEEKRNAYNRQSPHFFQNTKSEIVTSETILSKVITLRKMVHERYAYRLSNRFIAKSVTAILNKDYLHIILKEHNKEVNEALVTHLIKIISVLPYRTALVHFDKLLMLSSKNVDLEKQVLKFINRKRANRYWEKYNVAIIIAFTIFICLLILWIS